MNELALAIPWLGKRNPAAARWVVILLAVGAPLIAVLFGKTWVRIFLSHQEMGDKIQIDTRTGEYIGRAK